MARQAALFSVLFFPVHVHHHCFALQMRPLQVLAQSGGGEQQTWPECNAASAQHLSIVVVGAHPSPFPAASSANEGQRQADVCVTAVLLLGEW